MKNRPAITDMSPEDRRAVVLTTVVGVVASHVGSMTYSALLSNVQEALSACEEEIGGDVMHATAVLCRSGLLLTDSLEGSTMTFGAETAVWASVPVTSFVHDDDYATDDDPEDRA